MKIFVIAKIEQTHCKNYEETLFIQLSHCFIIKLLILIIYKVDKNHNLKFFQNTKQSRGTVVNCRG